MFPVLFSVLNTDMSSPNPEELGKVKWLRNFETAQRLAKSTDKPILVLFQEVPGCGTCKRFGHDALSHPLIVDAIEAFFVPMAVYNNAKEDEVLLKQFGEPAWNNPVVRIVNAAGEDLRPRMPHYSPLELVSGMYEVLLEEKRQVPLWFLFLKENLESKSTKTEKATFAMHCFWTGEAKLGNIEGVLATKPGFMDGHEVVEVEFNPRKVSYEKLASMAKSEQCSARIFTHSDDQIEVAAKIAGENKISPVTNFRLDKDVKYYLSKSDYRSIPMLPNQAAKVNAALATRSDVVPLFSPSQIKYYNTLKDTKKIGSNLIGERRMMKIWEIIER